MSDCPALDDYRDRSLEKDLFPQGDNPFAATRLQDIDEEVAHETPCNLHNLDEPDDGSDLDKVCSRYCT
jgi:hypothetical protein